MINKRLKETTDMYLQQKDTGPYIDFVLKQRREYVQPGHVRGDDVSTPFISLAQAKALVEHNVSLCGGKMRHYTLSELQMGDHL